MSEVEVFDEGDFQGGSNQSKTIPVQASSLRKGQHVMLKGFPCKISDMSTSKTGKHGHAKVHFTGNDIFTGKKYEALESSTHNMEQPVIKRSTYAVTTIDEDVTVFTDEGEEKILSLPIDEEIKETLQKLWAEAEEDFDAKDVLVEVIAAMDKEQIVNAKWGT